jgi:hypothetical protein
MSDKRELTSDTVAGRYLGTADVLSVSLGYGGASERDLQWFLSGG